MIDIPCRDDSIPNMAHVIIIHREKKKKSLSTPTHPHIIKSIS